MTIYVRRSLSFLLFLFCSYYANAQIELSAGLDFSYPQLWTSSNTVINAGQFSAGLRGGLAWKPENILFYPSLNLSYGRARLPLQEAGKGVATINFNYLAAMLNENYVVTLSRSQLLLYA